MAIKRYHPEQIIAKLREADVLLSQGHTVANVIKALEISEVHITAGERNMAA